jgi:putative tryptophan/tyrosine transport system substrate-binding protein
MIAWSSLSRRGAVLALLLLWCELVLAQALLPSYELRVLSGPDSPVTREIVQTLSRRYPRAQIGSDIDGLAARRGPAVYLAVGPAALEAALAAEVDSPVVSVFTSSPVFVDMLRSAPRRRAPVTAIYAEASPADQLKLIAQLYRRRVTVAVLLTEGTAYLEPILRRAAQNEALDLHLERLASDDNVIRALARVPSSAVLLAVPDNRIYNAANLRTILESTYRRGQAVVGFSTALVAAGTLAGAYSSIDDTLAQLDSVLDAIAAGHPPEPQFPRYWRVAINENVARSLNVVIDDSVRSLGHRPPTRSQ